MCAVIAHGVDFKTVGYNAIKKSAPRDERDGVSSDEAVRGRRDVALSASGATEVVLALIQESSD